MDRRKLPPRLPRMIRFLAGHCVLGVTIGVAAATLMLWLDVGAIGSLVSGDGARRIVPLALLYFGFSITFGSLAMGSAVFLLPRGLDEDGNDGDGMPSPGDHALRCSAARIRSRWKV